MPREKTSSGNNIISVGECPTITQTDLAEVAMWKERRREADKEIRRKRRMIENGLQAGCRLYRKSKVPTRLIRMKIPVDLAEALQEMAGYPDGRGGRTLHNMIVCSLMFAVWAHGQGRGPDVEMMASTANGGRGYTKWNEQILERRRRLK